ncbi:serine-type D-Ala-D-Ala carboxypeptidase [Pseudomonas sp. M47T1]|uniref:D-alanyl-D-alanine carboxypeptidase family protein n=1 Tax=unclassified Pseudomonas TaxID=196821 RepID=UPI0002608113|nr:D-alanyl-D-alanine carboxypeptidase family protein [Pseudomonas sp. M47T1]EIK93377.1 serine-type D-Ala-D-Ala carboxypeptidase [Pseudomonas sp. M47T1]
MNHLLLRTLVVLILLACPYAVFAQPADMATLVPRPPSLNAKAWVLMDDETGAVITEHASDQRLPPASLTKLMTAYLATREMQAGRLKPDDLVPVSENAWRTGGSRMFLKPGSPVAMRDLLRGIIIDSGNDASVAVAEHIAGSTDSFVPMMNAAAEKLGMHNTHFANPTGLPMPDHYSSAHDMAVLARAIINDESSYYELYAHKYLTWNGIRQPNRNLLLWRDRAYDGLKTGHTEAAGYCMVASAVRDGRRLISVVFGATSERARAEDSAKLMGYGFRFFATQHYVTAGKALATPRVWLGRQDTVAVGLAQDMSLTLPINQQRHTRNQITLNEPLQAPLAAGSQVGTLALYAGDQLLATRPLVALQAVPAGNWFSRCWDRLRMWVDTLMQDSLA